MRIRTIRPEFWESPQIGRLSVPARLTFIGLWNLADREGRLKDRPEHIAIKLFPYDRLKPSQVDRWLDELARQNLIIRYKVGDESYIAIPTWRRHQRPHPHEAPSEIPAPENYSCCNNAPASNPTVPSGLPSNPVHHQNSHSSASFPPDDTKPSKSHPACCDSRPSAAESHNAPSDQVASMSEEGTSIDNCARSGTESSALSRLSPPSSLRPVTGDGSASAKISASLNRSPACGEKSLMSGGRTVNEPKASTGSACAGQVLESGQLGSKNKVDAFPQAVKCNGKQGHYDPDRSSFNSQISKLRSISSIHSSSQSITYPDNGLELGRYLAESAIADCSEHRSHRHPAPRDGAACVPTALAQADSADPAVSVAAEPGQDRACGLAFSEWEEQDLWLLRFLRHRQSAFSGELLEVLAQDYLFWCRLSEVVGGFDMEMLEREFAKMALWIAENPNRAPSVAGVKRFVARWMERAVRKPEGRSGADAD